MAVDFSIIGERIKKARKAKKMTQEDLAEKCEISRNSVSLSETGKINPTILRVIDIARVLSVDVNELIKDA